MSLYMSVDEFIAKIPKGGWELVHHRMIRRFIHRGLRSNIAVRCPITAVADRDDLWNWPEIADEIGLRYDDANAIAFAADEPRPSGLRTRLLEACGLTEFSETK
jgi:hypothetical protein